MVSRIIYTAIAKEDLKEIFQFISKDSKYYAKLQILRIKHSIHILKTFPKAGREVPEYKFEYIREIIEGNYRIIYMIVSDERIDILTVHHSSKLLNISAFL